MKRLLSTLLLVVFGGSAFAEPGGVHHKITTYDYHDYVNSDIISKTFSYDPGDGSTLNQVWHIERPHPGQVTRTEVMVDADDNILRYRVQKISATPKAFNWLQLSNYSGHLSDPQLVETSDYDPPVVLMTDAMIPGIAWGTGGKMNNTYSSDTFFTDTNEILAIETVTVPAGTFTNCLKIYRQRNYKGFYTRIEWICPNIGLVKRVHAGSRKLELADITYGN